MSPKKIGILNRQYDNQCLFPHPDRRMAADLNCKILLIKEVQILQVNLSDKFFIFSGIKNQ